MLFGWTCQQSTLSRWTGQQSTLSSWDRQQSSLSSYPRVSAFIRVCPRVSYVAYLLVMGNPFRSLPVRNVFRLYKIVVHDRYQVPYSRSHRSLSPRRELTYVARACARVHVRVSKCVYVCVSAFVRLCPRVSASVSACVRVYTRVTAFVRV